MSAWVIDFEHINVLVWAGLSREFAYDHVLTWYWGNPTRAGRLEHHNATEVGRMLVRANVDSMKACYGDNLDDLVEGYEYRRPRSTSWSRVEILKAIHCFEYQSCEVKDWGTTEAFAFCRHLESAIVRSLPGYSEAPWGIERTTVPWLDKKESVRR